MSRLHSGATAGRAFTWSSSAWSQPGFSTAHGDLLLLLLLGSFRFQGVGSGLDLSPAVKKTGFRFRGFGVQTATLITPVARHSNP